MFHRSSEKNHALLFEEILKEGREEGGGESTFIFFLRMIAKRKSKSCYDWVILFRLKSKGFPYQDSIGGGVQPYRWSGKEEAERLQDQA